MAELSDRLEEETDTSIVVFALLSLIVGIAAGFIGAFFRITLQHAEGLRSILLIWAHSEGLLGSIIFITLCAAAIGITVWGVRRFAPQASGSGIPNVEAVLKGMEHPAHFALIPVKFFGGTLAMGSGLALGREGPSVQMGASIAYQIGRLCNRSDIDCRVLLAAGAGAGLATAFNAPIAGAIFVLEELMRRFETRTAVAALGASTTAIFVARLLLGNQADFQVAHIITPDNKAVILCILLGFVAGLIGVLYNCSILYGLKVVKRYSHYHPAVRGVIAGVIIGALALIFPHLVGGGEGITQHVLSTYSAATITLIPLYFLFRFVLGTFSYSIGTPGGLFAPMLTLGALVGIIFHTLCEMIFSTNSLHYHVAAIVGMAAFFSAVVRAPLTGMILVVEMTGASTLLLPLLGACFAAMVVPTMMRNRPVYEALSESGK